MRPKLTARSEQRAPAAAPFLWPFRNPGRGAAPKPRCCSLAAAARPASRGRNGFGAGRRYPSCGDRHALASALGFRRQGLASKNTGLSSKWSGLSCKWSARVFLCKSPPRLSACRFLSDLLLGQEP